MTNHDKDDREIEAVPTEVAQEGDRQSRYSEDSLGGGKNKSC
jgi:hypothetical protein